MELFRRLGGMTKTRSFWIGGLVTLIAGLIEIWLLDKSEDDGLN